MQSTNCFQNSNSRVKIIRLTPFSTPGLKLDSAFDFNKIRQGKETLDMREPHSEALGYGTHCEEISQFDCISMHLSMNGKNQCLA